MVAFSLENNNTIAAISTPSGVGGVGIVRVSGSLAKDIFWKLFLFKSKPASIEQVESHKLYLGTVTDPQTGASLDQSLAVLMRAPHSYTGEDVVEFQCHGGPLLLAKVLEAAVFLGAVLAQPGEFSLRAFLNGRMDLTQAEAVSDLVGARSRQALSLSVQQLTGVLSTRFSRLEDELLSLLAEIEVGIDFPEDEETLPVPQIIGRLQGLLDEADNLLGEAGLSQAYREGVFASLTGAVNVGKSSLMNALLQEDRVIVTELPGTTRDVVGEWMELDGLPIHLLDTAGLRETADPVEKIGIEKSRASARTAQLRILALEAGRALVPEEQSLLKEFSGADSLIVVNKCDLFDPTLLLTELQTQFPAIHILPVSARTGQGLDNLKQAMISIIKGFSGELPREGLLINLRQKRALLSARELLLSAQATLQNGLTPDLAAVDLMSAYDALGEITGKTAGMEVINKIFSSFCLGK